MPTRARQLPSFPAEPAIPPRRRVRPATAMPLLMRNFFLVSDLFMNATLRRARQKYFSNIAIFVRPSTRFRHARGDSRSACETTH